MHAILLWTDSCAFLSGLQICSSRAHAHAQQPILTQGFWGWRLNQDLKETVDILETKIKKLEQVKSVPTIYSKSLSNPTSTNVHTKYIAMDKNSVVDC
jgi:hypothetical protein